MHLQHATMTCTPYGVIGIRDVARASARRSTTAIPRRTSAASVHGSVIRAVQNNNCIDRVFCDPTTLEVHRDASRDGRCTSTQPQPSAIEREPACVGVFASWTGRDPGSLWQPPMPSSGSPARSHADAWRRSPSMYVLRCILDHDTRTRPGTAGGVSAGGDELDVQHAARASSSASRITWAVGDGAFATRPTTTVMLSSPPRSFASSISCCGSRAVPGHRDDALELAVLDVVRHAVGAQQEAVARRDRHALAGRPRCRARSRSTS